MKEKSVDSLKVTSSNIDYYMIGPGPSPLLNILKRINKGIGFDVFEFDEISSFSEKIAFVYNLNWAETFVPRKFGQYLAALHPKALELLRNGTAKILLDGSLEGYCNIVPFLRESDLLDIPRSAFIYFTQNDHIDDLGKQYTLFSGDGVKAVNVHGFMLTSSIVAQANAYKTHETIVQQSDFSKLPEKRFLCFNNRAKAHRAVVVGHMLEAGYFDRSTISFSPLVSDQLKGLKRDVAETFPSCKLGASVLDDLAKQTPMVIDFDLPQGTKPKPQEFNFVFGEIVSNQLLNAAISIVTESEFSDGEMKRITEKTLKSLAFGHPFIIVGNPGSLDTIRKMGFRTMHPLIDEAYDTELNPDRRMNLILREIDKMALLSDKELEKFLVSSNEIRAHNISHYRNVYPYKYVKDMIIRTCDEINYHN